MSVSMQMPILIVDDYNTTIRVLRNLLRQLGFSNIDEASDGKTALAKLRSKPYGLVVSNWSMEAMSGKELLQRIQSDDRCKDMKFVMIANDNHEADDGARAGASGYIMKPLNAQSLKTKLSGVIGAF
ncbi:response regulator [Terricaulis sp.]|uniref:response regulator n=1 Tax=Terricaulis sp. TaxID=2768686 RepID=UPI0037831F26